MENYTLSKPIEYDGEMITEILMDLDELTVRKIEQAEREAQKLLSKGEVMALPEYNKKYLACVAAKAAGVKSGLIFALGAKDYTQITMLVRGFLLGGDSDEERIFQRQKCHKA